jgi:hypothetical protein
LSGFAIPDASLPLTFTYSTYDYLNTDINYNSSGITQVQVLVQPETFIYGNSTDTATNLGSMPRASALTVALAAVHGFPLTTHSSIVLQTEESYIGLSTPLSRPSGLLPRYLNDYLPGNSSEYLSGDLGASFVFPFGRQINGGLCYTDALYGTVGYDLRIVTNTTTFENDVSQAFVKSSFDKEHVLVSHVFSAGARLGFFKSFLFSRTLAAKAYWDVWKQKFTMNLELGM